MAVGLSYEDDLARVRITAPAAVGATGVRIERSVGGLIWRTVRGGQRLDASGGTVNLDDYEFEPGAVNTYRAISLSPVDVTLGTESNTITPVIDRVWLKSIARPFLNMRVTVRDYSAVSRRARAGLFEIPGRSFPVRVADVGSSRSWTTEVITYDLTEARSLEYLIASGDVVLVQVPPAYDIPGGYVGLGDMTRGRISRPLSDGRRQFSLPMTEVAAPAASVVGYAGTWEGLLAEFGTWTAVMTAFPTWADLLEYVTDPSVIVAP